MLRFGVSLNQHYRYVYLAQETTTITKDTESETSTSVTTATEPIGARKFEKTNICSHLLIGCVVFISIILHLSGKPFDVNKPNSKRLHDLEFVALTVCFFTFWGGLLFFLGSEKPGSVSIFVQIFTLMPSGKMLCKTCVGKISGVCPFTRKRVDSVIKLYF